MPGFSRLDSVLQSIRARSARNGSATSAAKASSPVVAEALERRQLLSVSSIQVAVVGQPAAGVAFSGPVATFTDSAGSASDPSSFAVALDFGDGDTAAGTLSSDGQGNYTVTGSDIFPWTGTYTVSALLTQTNSGTDPVSGSAAVTVRNAPLDPLDPESFNIATGQSFAGEVGRFVDTAGSYDPSLFFTPTIYWGDGGSSAGTLEPMGGGTYAILGSYTYAEPGSFSGSVPVAETDTAYGSSTTLSFASNVAGPDAPLDAGSYAAISATQGQPFAGEVGTFFDEAAGDSNPSDLSATIHWGDGNNSEAALVPLGGGSYSVQGSNTYQGNGSYTGSVQVADQGGSSASLGFTASVAAGSYSSDAPLNAGSPETIAAVEGQTFTGEIGNFTDSAGSDSNPSDLSATIEFGDGASSAADLVPLGNGSYSVQGTNVYNAGTYNGSVQIADQGGSGASLTFTANVADAQLDPGASETISATQSQLFTGEVGTFVDAAGAASNPADLSATIDFGDGNANSPATLIPLGNGSYSVQGANTYGSAGSYAGSVLVNDRAGSSASMSFAAGVGSYSTADAPLDAGNPESINATAGQTYFGEVANFYDESGYASNAGDLSATIHWGDGTTSTGIVTALNGGGSYAVVTAENDPHTYSSPGSYSGSVDVVDQAGSSITGGNGPLFTAYVGSYANTDAPLDPGSAQTITAAEGQSFSGSLGTFYDEAGDNSTPSALSATITWGDGNTSPATLAPTGGGSYSVLGSNTFAEEGSYNGTVEIIDSEGSSTSLNFSVSVADAGLGGSSGTIASTEGQTFSGEVAVLGDSAAASSDGADLSATIDFGDGNTAAGALVPLGGGSYSIQGANTYLEEGTYSGAAIVNDQGGGTVSLGFSAVVADAPLAAGAPESINVVAGQTYQGEVGTFADTAGAASNPADLSATINWDDGTSSPGVLVPLGGGTYSVTTAPGDQHVYAREDTYNGTVDVTDQAGSSLTGDNALAFTATVADAPLDAGAAETVTAAEGVPTEVATFFDEAASGSNPLDLTATISYPDGSSAPARVVAAGGSVGTGSYSVQTTFASEGTYTGTAHIADGAGSSASVGFTATAGDAALDAGGPPGAPFYTGPQSITPVAGQTFSGQVAVFYDEAGTSSNPANLSGTITWGDGQTSAATIVAEGNGGNYSVAGSNPYSEAGTYSGSVVVTDQGGSSVAMAFTANVLATAPLDAGNPETIAATQGQSFTGEVAKFHDGAGGSSNPSDLSATIDWGDGNTSAATLAPLGGGDYSIQGSNIYAAAGSLTGPVQVTDNEGTSTVSLTFIANVAASSAAPGPGLVPGSYTTIATNEGGQGFTGEVATFQDQAGSASDPSNLSATIDWGDGNTTAGTLVPLGGGSYGVQGSNTYENQANFMGTVQVTDAAGGSANIGFATSVGPFVELQAGSPETISSGAGQSFTGDVATFYDTAGDASDASNLVATIAWGDGNVTQATLVPLGGGSYGVQGSNVFADTGSYGGTVKVSDLAGDGISVGFSADVSSSYGGTYSFQAIHANAALSEAPSAAAAASSTTLRVSTTDQLVAGLANMAEYRRQHQLAPTTRVTIQMAPGIYTVTQPLQVTAADSHVTLEGTPGNGSIISGGVSISQWTAVTGVSGEYKASLPTNVGVFRNLYVNGGRATRAEAPEYGPISTTVFSDPNTPTIPPTVNFYGQVNQDETWTASPGAVPTAVQVPYSDFKDLGTNFANSAGTGNPIEFVSIHGFDEARLLISSVQRTGSHWTILFSNIDNAHYVTTQFQNNNPYYLDNYVAKSGSGTPTLAQNQWYEDVANNIVYYMPWAGQAAPTTAIAPTAIPGGGSLLRIGTQRIGTTTPASPPAPVVDFCVSGVQFSYAGWTGPSTTGYVGEQAGTFNAAPPGASHADNNPLLVQIGSTYSTEPPAVAVANASGTSINGCLFTHLGGAGLALVEQTSGSNVAGNTFTDISGNGIIVDGIQNYQDLADVNRTLHSDYKSIADFISSKDTIVGNIIDACGQEFPDAAGIMAGFADNLTIAGNSLYNLPAAGITAGRSANSFDGEYPGWADTKVKDGTWSVCRVKSNTITNAGLVMTDIGGIYLSGCSWNFSKNTGTFIEGNTIESVVLQGVENRALPEVQPTFATAGADNGIYVDTGANGVSVLYNTLFNLESNFPVFLNGVGSFWNTITFPWPKLKPTNGLTIDNGGKPPARKGTATAVAYWAYGNTYDGTPYLVNDVPLQ